MFSICSSVPKVAETVKPQGIGAVRLKMAHRWRGPSREARRGPPGCRRAALIGARLSRPRTPGTRRCGIPCRNAHGLSGAATCAIRIARRSACRCRKIQRGGSGWSASAQSSPAVHQARAHAVSQSPTPRLLPGDDANLALPHDERSVKRRVATLLRIMVGSALNDTECQ